MRAVTQVVTVDEMREVAQALLDNAKNGDAKALGVLLSYLLGPVTTHRGAPNPDDLIAEDEPQPWE